MASHMMLTERIVGLSKRRETQGPVVSVYLNTRWTDEQQRERTRAFLKAELRRAREGRLSDGVAGALDWVEAEAEALIGQAMHVGAHGVALFAGEGLREVFPVRRSLENTLLVGERPFLRPLAAALAETPSVLVVYVDTESARLIPVLPEGPGEEVRLESEVPGHHRRGGWAQLAQSRYHRHIEARRDRHLDAVAEVLGQLLGEHGLEEIVIAGSATGAAALHRNLPTPVAERVAGVVPGSRHDPAGELVMRAVDLIGRVGADTVQAALDAVLTDAAKGGRATAGLEGVLEALRHGAVDRLYLLHGFRAPGRRCRACAALQPGDADSCRVCREATTAIELGEAMVTRTLAAGGAVTVVDAHAGLRAVDGVAARLRFAP